MQSTSASPSSPVNQSTTTVAGAGGRSTVVSTLADVSSRALLLSGSLQHSSIQPPPSSPRKNHSGGNTIKEELAVPSPRSSGRHPTNEISSSSMRFFQEPPPPTATVRRTVAFAASHSRDEELQQLRIKKKQGKGGATGENDEGDDGTVLVRIHHKTGFTHVVVPAALAANASSSITGTASTASIDSATINALAANASSSITGTASTASIDSATINDGDCRHATVSQLSGDQNPDSPHHHPHPHHSHSHNRRSSAAVDKLRAFIRYKERKYDAINRLNRIGAFLVVFLFLNSVCRALGLSNESVYSITRHVAGVREGFGVFRNCENTAVFDTCHTWYDYPTSHIDARCHISNLHHKVNALWTFAIMDCACVGAALLMALITAFRPTRSKFHMAILCLCFLSVPFGIVTLVMYSHLVSCAKGQCAGIAECDEGFNWGFYVLIVAVISSFISGSFASSMRSYVFILKREANKESRMERRIRREQQEQWQRLQEQIDANNNNNANNNTNNEDAAMTDHHNIVFPLPLADDIGATREGGNSNAPFASASDDENGVVIETHRRVDGNDNSDDDDDDADEGDERRALLINRSRVRHQHRRVSSTNNAAAATNAAEISQSFRTDLRSPQADTSSAASSSNIAAAGGANAALTSHLHRCAGANAALTSHLQHHNSPSSSHNARNRRRSQGEFSLHSNSDNMSPSSSMRLEQQQQQQHNNNLSSLLSEQ
ncbi:transmembrane protein, putative, partial [Bodo saltans]